MQTHSCGVATAGARSARLRAAAAAVLTAGVALAGGPGQAAAAPAAGAPAAPGPAAPAGARLPKPPDATVARVAPAVLTAERAASARARASGKSVVVSAETNTGTLVTANPDGTFTLTETSSPVRAKRHGRWVPIDTTLARRADGTVAPGATATGVVFSGGGTGPMATLRQGGHRLSLVFPRRLPVPSLSGATATYRDVLPSVDLRLTADPSGFDEVLVVRTRAAAANPALTRLRMKIKTAGVHVTSAPDGTAAAVDGSGAIVFHSDPAVMWDSSAAAGRQPTGHGGPSAGARTGRAAAGSGASTGGGTAGTGGGTAGSGAHVVRFQVSVSSDAETLIPDRSMLTAAGTRYPVSIDPTWSGSPSQLHWARISSGPPPPNGPWNIYDSTSRADGDHPRAGYDNWPGGAGEVARTYYQMNTGGSTGTTGIGGAIITAAHMYINDDWAASSADTPVELLVCSQPVANTWDATHLNWSNKPQEGQLQDTVNSHENGSSVVPGTLDFNIVKAAQSASSGPWPNITFELRAPNEGDRNQWKQFASGGGATISISYMRRPDFVGGTGNPTITPSAADNGTTYTTSATPTLNITAEDTDGENVQTNYQVWQGSSASPATLAAQGLGPASGYAPHGGPYTVGTSLPDGVYEWRASATNPISSSNPQGLWTPWSAWQVFTVDTSLPPAPGVESPQFPAGQYGAAFGTPGTFTVSTDGSDNVKGYLFSLDGDLGSTVYNSAAPPPTWTGSGTPTAGKVYWLAADDNNGTGSEQTNGFASAAVTPGSTGPHRIYAKAVDQAGNTSAERTYAFYAGITTPSYVYGDQLVNGYTASDGTTVPAATLAVSHNAVFTVQPNCCGIAFADGAQAWLHNGSGTLTIGDSVTMHFEVPVAGYWDVGANLTTAQDYGQYSLTLDQGSATLTPSTLVSSFDAYHGLNVTTTYRDFGVPRDGTGTAIQLTKGMHTLTLTLLGKDSASAGYLAGIDLLRLAPVPASCPITDLTGCLNNTAISPDNGTDGGNADGSGDSFSANALANAGWKPGATLTVDGAPMTLPSYGTGKQDNIAAAGQLITVPSTGIANDGDAVVFLGFGTGLGGGLSGYTGHITYTSNCPYGTSQSYTLDNVPDWIAGPASAATLQTPYRNQGGNDQNTSSHPSVFAVSVPLDFPGCAVTSISLPVVSNGVSGTSPALHVLALGIRASSYVGSTSTTVDTGQGSYPNASNWTGTYAARQDGVINGGLGAVTIRIPVHVSAGNGGAGQVRVHLANTLGTTPVTIDDASLASQSSGAVPAGTPAQLTFGGGSKSVVIPAGSEVTTDPLTYPVAQLSTLLVSLHLAGAVPSTPAHGTARATSYLSATGTDAVMDTTGTPFAAPGASTITSVPYLTGVDVTSSGNSTGSLVLFGDQTINSDTASADTGSTTADDLAADLAAATGNNGAVPYGILAEGQNSFTTSNNLLPAVVGSGTPQSALNPADRSVLTAASVRTVLISTGTSDILAGTGASTIEARLAALAQQIRAFYADNPSGNSLTGQLTVYVATIPPDARFTGAQEAVREAVNQYILSTSGGDYLDGNADGAIDFAAAVSSTGTDSGTAVNAGYLTSGYPNNAYYRALAQQYITSTDPSAGTVAVQPNTTRKPR